MTNEQKYQIALAALEHALMALGRAGGNSTTVPIDAAHMHGNVRAGWLTVQLALNQLQQPEPTEGYAMPTGNALKP